MESGERNVSQHVRQLVAGGPDELSSPGTRGSRQHGRGHHP